MDSGLIGFRPSAGNHLTVAFDYRDEMDGHRLHEPLIVVLW